MKIKKTLPTWIGDCRWQRYLPCRDVGVEDSEGHFKTLPAGVSSWGA